MTIGLLILALVLTLGTALFVAAEFSLVALDRPAVQRAVDEGDARARPVLDALAASAPVVGPRPGDGQRVKIVNQLLCGVHIAAAGEALAACEALVAPQARAKGLTLAAPRCAATCTRPTQAWPRCCRPRSAGAWRSSATARTRS